jgi:hypothetical protein
MPQVQREVCQEGTEYRDSDQSCCVKNGQRANSSRQCCSQISVDSGDPQRRDVKCISYEDADKLERQRVLHNRQPNQ